MLKASSGSVDKVSRPALYPPDLVRQIVLTYAPPASVILDPYSGSGTTCLVAQSENYNFIGFDNGTSSDGERYADMAMRRLRSETKYFRPGGPRRRGESARARPSGAVEMPVSKKRKQPG